MSRRRRCAAIAARKRSRPRPRRRRGAAAGASAFSSTRGKETGARRPRRDVWTGERRFPVRSDGGRKHFFVGAVRWRGVLIQRDSRSAQISCQRKQLIAENKGVWLENSTSQKRKRETSSLKNGHRQQRHVIPEQLAALGEQKIVF